LALEAEPRDPAQTSAFVAGFVVAQEVDDPQRVAQRDASRKLERGSADQGQRGPFLAGPSSNGGVLGAVWARQ
jgi:hypothetical protein